MFVNDKLMNRLKAQQYVMTKLGLLRSDAKDEDISLFVSNSIKDVKVKVTFDNKEDELKNVMSNAVLSFKRFDDGIISRKVDKLAKDYTYIDTEPLPYYFTCHIGWKFDPVLQLSVGRFQIPSLFDGNSYVWLSHEYIHALKEVNKQEFYLTLKTADVIPILYEFILSDDKNKYNKKQIYSMRLDMIKSEAYTFMECMDLIDSDKSNRELYQLLSCNASQYLNSYYYALLLYDMYLQDSVSILKYIKRVLNHEITTLQMLEYLDLYHKDNDIKYNNGLYEVLKMVK